MVPMGPDLQVTINDSKVPKVSTLRADSVIDTKVPIKSDSTVKSRITEINSIDSTVKLSDSTVSNKNDSTVKNSIDSMVKLKASAVKFTALPSSEKEIDTGHLPPHTERGGFKKME